MDQAGIFKPEESQVARSKHPLLLDTNASTMRSPMPLDAQLSAFYESGLRIPDLQKTTGYSIQRPWPA
jgi:hypothetical protein